MTYAGTGLSGQSISRLKQMLNVPNIRPILEDVEDLVNSVSNIQNSNIGDFGPPIANLTMNGYRLIDVADPLDMTDVSNKRYVDNSINGVSLAIGWPYNKPQSLDARVSTLEATPGTSDVLARAAIGWPYDTTQTPTLNQRIADWEN